LPPVGARQDAGFIRTLQLVRPLRKVRQHTTARSLPHVDFPAQEIIRSSSPRHSARNRPSCLAAPATRATQLMYCPWLVAPAQSQAASISARTSASWLASPASLPHCPEDDAPPLPSSPCSPSSWLGPPW